MKAQNKLKAGNFHTKKRKNKKNRKRHQQINKHFSKRSKKKEVWKIETQRKVEELYKVHLEIAKHYQLTRPEEKDTRSLEERAKEMRQMKSKGASQLEEDILSWSQFAREQRNNNRRQRIVLHTGETL